VDDHAGALVAGPPKADRPHIQYAEIAARRDGRITGFRSRLLADLGAYAIGMGPGVPIQYADIGGTKVRYIKTGAGPNLVLLHTLRTQLDIFAGCAGA
jgi:hypothetical protein